MKLEERKAALLRLVEEYRERECRHILDAAREEARRLIDENYRKERAHLHERVVSERSRARARIDAARAEQATRERWSSERLSIGLLESAWPFLRARLAARWLEARGRRAWTGRYLDEALQLLPKGRWRIRHEPRWGESERRDVVEGLVAQLGITPTFETDGRLVAGLVVECEGAVLDASLEGLLRDRGRLEARLLALMATVDADGSSD